MAHAVQYLNLGLGLLVFALVLVQAAHDWPRYSRVSRGAVASLVLFALAATWGAGEELAQGEPTGPGSGFTLLALLHLGYSMVTNWRDPDDPQD